MKLLIVYHAGLGEEAKKFYREYVKQGIDLTVIAPSKLAVDKVFSPSGCLAYNPKHSEKGYNFLPVDLREPSNYGWGFKFFQLFRAIKKAKPEVIHVLDEYSSIYLAQVVFFRNILYGKKVPVLAYSFHNIPFIPDPLYAKNSRRFFHKIIYKTLRSFIFYYNKKYISGITGANTEGLENIKEMGAKCPMRHIFWGVDFNVFQVKNKDLCREKLGIPRDIKLVGYFGRIIEEKGLCDIVEAASRIKNCFVVFVGSGDYESELKRVIEFFNMKDKVFIYSSVSQDKIADYYNCLDCFILASRTMNSWKEQYGRVLVEAMACQIPIIGSSSGAIPEVLNGYPKHLIFREDSIDDLADKIKKIDELKFPGNFNLDKLLYKFSVENFVREHIKFYKTLLI